MNSKQRKALKEFGVELPKEEKEVLKTKWFILGALSVTALILISFIIFPVVSESFYDKDVNESFINGTIAGMDYALYQLTNQSINCQQIPITYANYSYTLYPLECLNLNTKQEGNNNGI